MFNLRSKYISSTRKNLRLNSFLFLAFFTLSGATDSLRAQENISIGQKLSNDLSAAWKDGINYFNFPSRFDRNDWYFAAGTIGGTLVLMPLDSAGKKFALKTAESGKLNATMDFFRGYGDAKYPISAALVTYFTGLFSGWDGLRVTSRQVLQAMLYAGIVSTTFKFVIGRARPYEDQGPYSFNPFKTNNGLLSMPSGHATVAFALSSVLAERIGNIWASIGLYGAATMTGFSRMYHNQHWLSDVFFGAAIGTASGLYVVHQEERGEDKSKNTGSGIFISPSLGSLNIEYKF
jgi:hypothetical protein